MPVITLLPLSSYPPSFALLCHTRVSHVNIAPPPAGIVSSFAPEGCWRGAGGQRCFSFPTSGFRFLPLFLLLGLLAKPHGAYPRASFRAPQWVVPVISTSTAASFWQVSQAPSRRSANKPHWCPDGQLSSAFPCRSFSVSSTHIPEDSSSVSIVHTLAHDLLLVRPGPRHLRELLHHPMGHTHTPSPSRSEFQPWWGWDSGELFQIFCLCFLY